MTTETITFTENFTGDELELIADALECLAVRAGRSAEVAAFAVAHPGFGLLAEIEEPVEEELL